MSIQIAPAAAKVKDDQNVYHDIPGFGNPVSPYNSNPAALGAAASPGSSNAYARGDHVHPKPSASDIGAVAVNQGVTNAGKFSVVGSDGNVTFVTLSTWQGGSY